MNNANHFSKKLPTVILLELPNQDVQVLNDEDGKPMVFNKWSKAAKFVSRNIEPKLRPFIRYANENPTMNAGDIVDTRGKRCLKCNGHLRLGAASASKIPNMGRIVVDEYVCPVCDLGEPSTQ